MALSLRVWAPLAVLSLTASGCALTSHEARPATLGAPKTSADLLAVIDAPGKVSVESVTAADWAVARGGLINLEHPRAKEGHIVEGIEPMKIFFYALQHPDKGLYLVDTGVEKALRDAPDTAAVRGIVARVAHTERLVFKNVLAEWIAARKTPIAGVFFTHLHIDHISGLRDVPHGAALFAGPGEAEDVAFRNLFLRRTTDDAFEGQAPLEEWHFTPDPTGRFEGVVDVFDDGQVWALSVPGHTAGSVAYVARTPTGPVLLVGDTCHTAWGWEHDVEPGEFTADQRRNAVSLARLRRLSREHPKMRVWLGHQRLPGTE